MVDQDFDAYITWFKHWKNKGDFKRVLLCSPNEIQRSLFAGMFPHSQFLVTTAKYWDLYKPCHDGPVDLIIACNIFHYLQEPRKAFENVFAACREFWIQDLVTRFRGDKSELGNDGDAARYFLSKPGTAGQILWQFNLGAYEDRLKAYHVYDGGSLQNRRTTVHFVASFTGDVQ